MSDGDTQVSSGGSRNSSVRLQMVHCQLCVDEVTVVDGVGAGVGVGMTYKVDWKLLSRAVADTTTSVKVPDNNTKKISAKEAEKRAAAAAAEEAAKAARPPMEGGGATRPVMMRDGVMLWRECFDMPCVEMGVPPVEVANRRFLDFGVIQIKGTQKKEIGRVKVEVRFDDPKRKKATLHFICKVDETSPVLRCALRISLQMTENALMRSKVMGLPPGYIRGAERSGAAAFKPKDIVAGSSEATEATLKAKKLAAEKEAAEKAEREKVPVSNHASAREALPGEKRCHRCNYYFREDANAEGACEAHTGILERDYGVLLRNTLILGAAGVLVGSAGGGVYIGVLAAKAHWVMTANMVKPVLIGAEIGAGVGTTAGLCTGISESEKGAWTTMRYACCGTCQEKCPETRKHSEW